jgi:four helix bundle protein
MGVYDFRELVCWKLSQALKVEIPAFTDRGPAAQDFKYRDQIRDSAASAPRNIAEGFGHFGAREFARFLGYARASLMETASSLVDGHDRKYLDTKQYSRLMNLTRRAEGNDRAVAAEASAGGRIQIAAVATCTSAASRVFDHRRRADRATHTPRRVAAAAQFGVARSQTRNRYPETVFVPARWSRTGRCCRRLRGSERNQRSRRRTCAC